MYLQRCIFQEQYCMHALCLLVFAPYSTEYKTYPISRISRHSAALLSSDTATVPGIISPHGVSAWPALANEASSPNPALPHRLTLSPPAPHRGRDIDSCTTATVQIGDLSALWSTLCADDSANLMRSLVLGRWAGLGQDQSAGLHNCVSMFHSITVLCGQPAGCW